VGRRRRPRTGVEESMFVPGFVPSVKWPSLTSDVRYGRRLSSAVMVSDSVPACSSTSCPLPSNVTVLNPRTLLVSVKTLGIHRPEITSTETDNMRAQRQPSMLTSCFSKEHCV
jgi:hypothetical protein